MRWQVKSLLVVLAGMWLIALGSALGAYWSSNFLIGFLTIFGTLLVIVGTLHFCLNTIVESLTK